MSMMCRPMWPFLLTYESHDMRHTGFSQVDGLSTRHPGIGASQLRLKLGDYGLMHNRVGYKGSTNSKDGLYHFLKDVLPRISPQMILEQVLKSREI